MSKLRYALATIFVTALSSAPTISAYASTAAWGEFDRCTRSIDSGERT